MRTGNSFSYFAILSLAAFAGLPAILTAQTAPATTGKKQTGTAIFYSDKLHGHALTTGEKYDKNALTAAHRTLPFGTMVRVTNLKNDKSVVVRINDRGPHGPKSQIIDVSGRAAQELDMIEDGRAKVTLEVVEAAKK